MNKPSICIIDDDEIYQFLCKKTIEQSSLINKVIIFSNGQDALTYFTTKNKLSEELPDVIFLDIDMPLMDGWQFLEAYLPLKENIDKRIIIYFVTSSSHPGDMARAKEISEISGYLIKPISVENFKEIILKYNKISQ